MKYFKEELWEKYNNPKATIKDLKKIDNEWNEAFKEYDKLFELLTNRFSKKFLSIYNKNLKFHDFIVKEFQIIQEKSKPIINLVITDGFDIFKITYKNVKSYSVSRTDANLNDDAFGDWGYDEFLEIDKDTLSHEILFASGASIFIKFKNNNVFITKQKEEYKGCENCGNYIYEKNPEDYDEYCLNEIDINIVPTEEKNPNYKCPKWKKEKK